MSETWLRKLRAVHGLMMVNGFIPLHRRPLALVAILSTPFSFLFFIYIFGHAQALLAGCIGGLIFTVINSATMLQSDLLFFKIDLKFQQIAVSSGISPLNYVIGMASGNMLFMLPGLVFFMTMIVYLTPLTVIAGIMIVATVLVTWLMFSLISYLISTRIREMKDIWPVSVIFSILFAVIPPIYYSVESLPLPYRYVAYAVPTTFSALIIKNSVSLNLAGALIYFAIFATEAAAVIIITYLFADWRTGRS